MDLTVEELWMMMSEHCGAIWRCCQDPPEKKNPKAMYERLGRMQEIAKEILSK